MTRATLQLWRPLALLIAAGTPGAWAADPAAPPLSEHCARLAAARTASAAPAPAPEAPRYARSVRRYRVPDLRVTDQEGRTVPLASAFPTDRPVALNFIFTTCTTVCPVQTATFTALRKKLAGEGTSAALVSISIDPEHDRPAVLKRYAERFGAPSDWRLYTGDAGDIRRILDSFEAFSGDKANHQPVTLLRMPGSEEWVRLVGFPGATELAGELHGMLAAK